MLEEYIVGSHMSYVRNPNYWAKATINGKEYQMPFIDRLVIPILPDLATQMAALRTGTIEFMTDVPASQFEMLDRTAPQMLKSYLSIKGMPFMLRQDEPPFNDVRIRRALMIGTNVREFQKLMLAENLPFFWYPYTPENPLIFTPLEEMPEDIQTLYDYNPTLAKQMIAEVYPDGLKIDIMLSAGEVGLTEAIALGSLVKDQWAKIGVEVTLEPLDLVTFRARIYSYPPGYHGAALFGTPIADPVYIMTNCFKTGGYFNFGLYSNPEVDALSTRIEATRDEAEKSRLAKEAAIIVSREALCIPLALIPSANCWWPWVKNYDGELTLHDCSPSSLVRYMWIDQDLKAEMGY